MTRHKWSTPVLAAASVAAVLGTAAIFVRYRAGQAEANNPPSGKFLNVEGVRLHYVDRGEGVPVVFIHGNGSSIQDLDLSGVMALDRERYRVIAFDRPGFGYSERPAGHSWDAASQAALIAEALERLGIERPLIVAHSWGTLVALELALRERMSLRGLVLLSGYYFPTPRTDVMLASLPAVPVLGALLRNTLSPLLARLAWPAIRRRIFSPSGPTPAFMNFPVWMALRPSQLGAAAAESAMMVPAAARLSGRYQDIDVPVFIHAGKGDKISDADTQSGQLKDKLRHAELEIHEDTGHMIHHLLPLQIMAVVEKAVAQTALPADSLRVAPTGPDSKIWH